MLLEELLERLSQLGPSTPTARVVIADNNTVYDDVIDVVYENDEVQLLTNEQESVNVDES